MRSPSPFVAAGLLAVLGACSGDPIASDAGLPPAPDAQITPDAAVSARDAGVTMDADVVADAGIPPSDAGSDVTVTLRVQVPANTPDDGPVHIAGDFQGWDPADPAHALTEVEPQVHSIDLTLPAGTQIAFKFARGDWSKVEKGASGQEIPDRQLTFSADGVETLVVASWADASPLPGTITGNVQTVQVPNFLDGRRVWVYLPPTYDDDTVTRYSVLYMLDGQNMFDQRTSFAGEWGIDETLEMLIPMGEVEPLIVVAVDNGGGARLDEYTPWIGSYQGSPAGGGGQDHLQTIATVLKPWVDANFRTKPEPQHTGFSGSSLGGLMSVYTAYARPDVFGRVGALSPSIWWANEILVQYVRDAAKPAGVRLWVDMGTMESSADELVDLERELLADGFVEGTDLRVVLEQGAGHNEAAWRRRMPDVLRFLFPASP